MPSKGHSALIILLVCCSNIHAQPGHGSGSTSHNPAHPGARILRGPESTVAPIGDEVLFQCELSLTPERVTWLHQPDGVVGGDEYRELDEEADFKRNGYSSSLRSTTASLRVRAGSGPFGSGRFRCSARFGPLALASTPALLTLATLGDFDLGPSANGQSDSQSGGSWAGATSTQGMALKVPAGNRVVMMCPDVESSPKAVIQFYKYNKPLPSSIAQLPSGAIVLTAVTEADSGRYTCSALNELNDEVARTTVAFDLQVYRSEKSEAPRFLQTPRSIYTTRAGLRVLLECSGVGLPVPVVQWTRQGATIITPPGADYQTSRYRNGDGGYRSGSGGSSSSSGGYPDPSGGSRGGSINQPRVVITEHGLRIENVTSEDAGVYECTLLDPTSRNRPVSHRIRLEVDSPPEIFAGEEDVTNGGASGAQGGLSRVAREGASVELLCDVTGGSPAPEVYWMLNARPAERERGVAVVKNRLIINPVSRSHAGAVQCFAKNRIGETYQSGVLQVVVAEVSGGAAGGQLDEAELMAQAVAQAKEMTADVPRVHAAIGGHHGGAHEGGQRHQGGSRGNGGNKKGHRGKDGRGRGRSRDKKRNRDAVMIPPTRPNVTRLSDESVMVRWSVPKNDGLEISFFKVQYRDLTVSTHTHARGHKGWITTNDVIPPHIRSYEVNNLEPDHVYRFRIAAVYSNNDNKLGPNSERFPLQRGAFLGRAPLPAPVLLRTEALGPDTVQIHWQYTPDVSRPADGFYLYYRPASTAGEYVKATVEDERTRSWRVRHLEADTTYELKVQSFTASGASEFSAILTQRTGKLTTESPTPMVIMDPGGARHEAASGGASGGGADQGGGSGGALAVGGGAAGGAALLAVAAMMTYVVRRRRNKAAEEGDEEKDGNNDCSGSHDKSPEPSDNTPHHISAESNGYITASAINPHNYQVKTVQITANGCARVNITSNPLAEEQADKNASLTLTELEMEMSMLSQNNNMSGSSGGSSSRTTNNSMNSNSDHKRTTNDTRTTGNGLNHQSRGKKYGKHHGNNPSRLQRNEVNMNSNSSIENYV